MLYNWVLNSNRDDFFREIGMQPASNDPNLRISGRKGTLKAAFNTTT